MHFLLRDKWPTVHVLVFLEVSSARSQFATFLRFKSRMDCISFDASSFCHMERLRTFHISSPVRWSWECHSSLSRNGVFLQLPVDSGQVPSLLDSSAEELERSLQFQTHHAASGMATSARKQKPYRLEQTRVALLSGSICCAVVAWLVDHCSKASGYLTAIPDLLSLRSCSVSAENLHSVTLTEHSKLRSFRSNRGSDVRLDTGQFMKPDVWTRAPTDPSRWAWKMRHSLRWKHNGHTTELEMLSALTAIRWLARSSSLLRTCFVLFIDNQSSLALLVKSPSSSRSLNGVARKAAAILLGTLSKPLYAYTDTDRNPPDAGSRSLNATTKNSCCTKDSTHSW